MKYERDIELILTITSKEELQKRLEELINQVRKSSFQNGRLYHINIKNGMAIEGDVLDDYTNSLPNI